MKRVMLLVAVVLAGLGLGFEGGLQEGKQDARTDSRVSPRFMAVDIFVDSGEVPLAAYQVEVNAGNTGGTPVPPTPGRVTLVGVEGGEHAAFKDPPRYDSAALHESQIQDRIILAAFNTGADLPKGSTRVARIQVQVEGPEPVYSVVVMAAGAADGTKINATAKAVAAGDMR